ncbi:MAG: pectinesterase family protein [Candidatus Thermoplasmatota archaeon]
MRREIRAVRGLLFILLVILLGNLSVILNISADRSGSLLGYNDSFIIVDIDGYGDYRCIQDAVDNAPNGSTIYIREGLYNENIYIKKRISLIGQSIHSTVVSSTSDNVLYGIRVESSDVIISNLSITNSNPSLYSTGIYISSSRTIVDNCRVYGTRIGIAVWSSYNTISNCVVTGCSDEGIALLGTEISQCGYNTINGCRLYGNGDGIEMQSSSYNNIINCEIYDNTHTGINCIGSSNNNNVISSSRIYSNKVHGLYLSDSSGNQVTGSYISDNFEDDVLEVRGSYDNYFNGCIGNPQVYEMFDSDSSFNNVYKGFFSHMLDNEYSRLSYILHLIFSRVRMCIQRVIDVS